VQNDCEGVIIEIEGGKAALSSFLKSVQHCSLRLARITGVAIQELPPTGQAEFIILASAQAGNRTARISPDVSVCQKCQGDIFAAGNRRFAYPFTNCSDCGPRFTIVTGVPYDRAKTTMSGFAMCPHCTAEYHDPADRRFHAQPNACPLCGPRVTLTGKDGEEVAGDWRSNFLAAVAAGKIVAVKGLGGFHLSCDAQSRAAVATLRERKGRPARPFAVMCRDLGVVRRFCLLEPAEEELLVSPAAPIVLLRRRADCPLPRELAPGLGTVGIMLPYTPLHHLLFDERRELLVMTSGNGSSLPLVKDNGEALRELAGLADLFLLHDRDIQRRCDDSLVQVVEGAPQLMRRSRGYVPDPVSVPAPPGAPAILGVGGDLKNTFCLLTGGKAYFGPHTGDFGFRETVDVYLEALETMQRLLETAPAIVACDSHPGYHSARLAAALPSQEVIEVFHHHAHLASCLGENKLHGPVIAVVCDGSGYGPDGTVWGGEVLTGDYLRFRREFHLEQVPLPGGEAAVRQPWRMAATYLYCHLGKEGERLAREILPQEAEQLETVFAMLKSGFNSPLTSSCGRLYDAVAALLGVAYENSYEGQAAMELAELAEGHAGHAYPFSLKGGRILTGDLWRGMVRDSANGFPRSHVAASFQQTLVEAFAAAVAAVREKEGLEQVVLSGGSFQNRFLLTSLGRRLTAHGFTVYRHRQVPPNDGGLALGQTLVAAWRRHVKCV
jgi:hydrogenase maturation protein HypF